MLRIADLLTRPNPTTRDLQEIETLKIHIKRRVDRDKALIDFLTQAYLRAINYFGPEDSQRVLDEVVRVQYRHRIHDTDDEGDDLVDHDL